MNEADKPCPSDRRRLSARRRVYRALEPARSATPADNAGRINAVYTVEAILVTVILINSASLILWTVPALGRSYSLWFHIVEYCTVAVFFVEYALRFWAAPEANPEGRDWRQRWKYVISPVALIDAAALYPSAAAAVTLLVSGDGPSLSFLLAVRLITRSAKLARYFSGARRLGMAVRLKSSQILTAIAALLLLLLIAASLMFFAESAAQPDKFTSIPAAMWWSVVTLTTVGYGDLVPVTTTGRLLAAVIAVMGIGLFALPAGILSAGLLEADADGGGRGSRFGRRSVGDYCPHCGQRIAPEDADEQPGGS